MCTVKRALQIHLTWLDISKTFQLNVVCWQWINYNSPHICESVENTVLHHLNSALWALRCIEGTSAPAALIYTSRIFSCIFALNECGNGRVPTDSGISRGKAFLFFQHDGPFTLEKGNVSDTQRKVSKNRALLFSRISNGFYG